MRKTKFANNEFYHVYNRGVDKRNIFNNQTDYVRFLKTLQTINNKGSAFGSKAEPLGIDIIAYCLNPNHYHLLIRQLDEKAVSLLMHRLSTSYTMFFNKANGRSGSLFEGRFKAVHISSNEHLLWVAAYINTNAKIHGIVRYAEDYSWCSYAEYLNPNNNKLNLIKNRNFLLDQFQSLHEFKELTASYSVVMIRNKFFRKYQFD